LSRQCFLFAHEIEPLDLVSDKAPRLHYVGQPAVEFFVRSDFVKKMIVDEPYLARLADLGVEAVDA
jgi:hypothetical protein